MAIHKKEYYGDDVAEVTITYTGKHWFPHHIFYTAQVANKFNSKITVSAKGKKMIGAENPLAWMAILGDLSNTDITFFARGSDATQAVKALVKEIESFES